MKTFYKPKPKPKPVPKNPWRRQMLIFDDGGFYVGNKEQCAFFMQRRYLQKGEYEFYEITSPMDDYPDKQGSPAYYQPPPEECDLEPNGTEIAEPLVDVPCIEFKEPYLRLVTAEDDA